MDNNYIEKQVKDANNNFNYFLVRSITLVIKALFIISLIFIINNLLNHTIINVISIIFSVSYCYYLFQKISYYTDVMTDIKNTISKDKICYELDLNIINNNLFQGRLNYGK